MTRRWVVWISSIALVLAACSSDAVNPAADPLVGDRSTGLGVESTWQWQLQGELGLSYDVDVYDIDLFDTDVEVIDQLHADGRVVICYLSAGSYEEWRDDASSFEASDLGLPLDGWEGERWLDIRSPSVGDIMEERFDLALDKGCDGVEPDNVTAHNNDTGFDITGDQQLEYNRFLARAAHDRGLSIGLKNDVDQVEQLEPYFDFAVNEECFEYDECEAYESFLTAGKPVFNAEYAAEYVADPSLVCESARAMDIRTLILAIELDDSLRISCDS